MPKREPKGYILSDVTQSLMSSAQHTPEAAPRVTQTSLGKYCRPIDFQDNDVIPDWKIEYMNPKVLDKYAKDNKAWWVDKPGLDTTFLHDIYYKYNVKVDTELDPRYKFNPRIFQRSFKYELDSLEDARQESIARKVCEDECREKQSNPTPLTPEEVHHQEICKLMLEMPDDSSEYRDKFGRWQDTPRLFAPSLTDPCSRRKAFQQVKQPFKHEACNWYYVNHPAPYIPFRPRRII